LLVRFRVHCLARHRAGKCIGKLGFDAEMNREHEHEGTPTLWVNEMLFESSESWRLQRFSKGSFDLLQRIFSASGIDDRVDLQFTRIDHLNIDARIG